MKRSNCGNCGAPLKGSHCEYCGTVWDTGEQKREKERNAYGLLNSQYVYAYPCLAEFPLNGDQKYAIGMEERMIFKCTEDGKWNPLMSVEELLCDIKFSNYNVFVNDYNDDALSNRMTIKFEKKDSCLTYGRNAKGQLVRGY